LVGGSGAEGCAGTYGDEYDAAGEVDATGAGSLEAEPGGNDGAGG
jgi:hypothetical protein